MHTWHFDCGGGQVLSFAGQWHSQTGKPLLTSFNSAADRKEKLHAAAHSQSTTAALKRLPNMGWAQVAAANDLFQQRLPLGRWILWVTVQRWPSTRREVRIWRKIMEGRSMTMRMHTYTSWNQGVSIIVLIIVIIIVCDNNNNEKEEEEEGWGKLLFLIFFFVVNDVMCPPPPLGCSLALLILHFGVRQNQHI